MVKVVLLFFFKERFCLLIFIFLWSFLFSCSIIMLYEVSLTRFASLVRMLAVSLPLILKVSFFKTLYTSCSKCKYKLWRQYCCAHLELFLWKTVRDVILGLLWRSSCGKKQVGRCIVHWVVRSSPSVHLGHSAKKCSILSSVTIWCCGDF